MTALNTPINQNKAEQFAGSLLSMLNVRSALRDGAILLTHPRAGESPATARPEPSRLGLRRFGRTPVA